MLPGEWPPEEAEEPIFFPNDNSVKSNNGGNELQRDEVQSADHKEERNTPVGGNSFMFNIHNIIMLRCTIKIMNFT